MASNCKETTPYWSVDSNVYHVCANCSVGNNIERDKRRSGTSTTGRTLCERCKAIRAGTYDR